MKRLKMLWHIMQVTGFTRFALSFVTYHKLRRRSLVCFCDFDDCRLRGSPSCDLDWKDYQCLLDDLWAHIFWLFISCYF